MRFLHLSDLHINQHPLGSPHDLDADIRDVVDSDAAALAEQLGGIDGILITGDVAFSGHNTEYSKAAVWLERLAGRIGCDADRVWVIPGNHDVDWSVLAAEPELLEAHDELRRCGVGDLTNLLSRRLLDKIKPPLLAPLGNYISFARNYGCQLTADQPFWVSELDAGDGHKIRVCGLSSPLLSDEHDDVDAHKLALGTFQCAIPWRPTDAVIVLCHHPPQWLRDGDEAEKYFDARAVLQLFGHKHLQHKGRWQNTVRLQSGALHPERGPGWQPRYNVITVDWPVQGTVRIGVRPRVWWDDLTRFGPDRTLNGAAFESWDLPLARAAVAIGADEGVGAEAPDHPISLAQDVVPDATASPERRLAYGLSRLPHLALVTLGVRLDLLKEEDDLRSPSLVDALIQRGQDAGRLAELWDSVGTQIVGDLFGLNPFRKEA